jgi:deoxyribonuclease IV
LEVDGPDLGVPRLGAHLSVAGGLPRAVERARALGCPTLQIFTKSAGQWRARPLPQAEVGAFRDAARENGIDPILAHASYLINIASDNPVLRARSVASLREELERADTLGLAGVVLHPGARADGTEDEALSRVADSLLGLFDSESGGRSMVLLEHTAGQGRSIGYTFEHLATILARTGAHPRLGVCLDTCHLFAAGYELGSESGYRQTFERFADLIGLERLKVFHLNDSKNHFGSRVDRHQHIGRGYLGLRPFSRLLNDARFARVPMIIETQKTRERDTRTDRVDPLDRMNLQTLRSLIGADPATLRASP